MVSCGHSFEGGAHRSSRRWSAFSGMWTQGLFLPSETGTARGGPGAGAGRKGRKEGGFSLHLQVHQPRGEPLGASGSTG